MSILVIMSRVQILYSFIQLGEFKSSNTVFIHSAGRPCRRGFITWHDAYTLTHRGVQSWEHVIASHQNPSYTGGWKFIEAHLMTLVYANKNATTKKGSGNVMGAELCLAHDMGGGGIGGPLLVDMRPYGCFILNVPFWWYICKISLVNSHRNPLW